MPSAAPIRTMGRFGKMGDCGAVNSEYVTAPYELPTNDWISPQKVMKKSGQLAEVISDYLNRTKHKRGTHCGQNGTTLIVWASTGVRTSLPHTQEQLRPISALEQQM